MATPPVALVAASPRKLFRGPNRFCGFRVVRVFRGQLLLNNSGFSARLRSPGRSVIGETPPATGLSPRGGQPDALDAARGADGIVACENAPNRQLDGMTGAEDIRSLERLLLPLRRELNAEVAGALLRLKVDADVQVRYEELAGKNTAGTLTADERNELASLVRVNSLLGVLMAEARAFLQRPTAV